MSEGGDWLKRLLGGILLAVGVLMAALGGLCGGLLVLITPQHARGQELAVVLVIVGIGVGLIVAGRKLGARSAYEMDAGKPIGQVILRRLGIAFAVWVALQIGAAGIAALFGAVRWTGRTLGALGGANFLFGLALVGFGIWLVRKSRDDDGGGE